MGGWCQHCRLIRSSRVGQREPRGVVDLGSSCYSQSFVDKEMFTGRWWVIEEDAAGGRASSARCGSATKGCSNELWLHRLILYELRWEDDPPAADLEFAAMIITFGISTLMAGKCCRRSGRVVALQGGARDSGDPAGNLTALCVN